MRSAGALYIRRGYSSILASCEEKGCHRQRVGGSRWRNDSISMHWLPVAGSMGIESTLLVTQSSTCSCHLLLNGLYPNTELCQMVELVKANNEPENEPLKCK